MQRYGKVSLGNCLYTHNVQAIACEVLARRVVHQAAPEQIPAIMSARFRHKEIDGDVSGRVSALEMAIDSHWYDM